MEAKNKGGRPRVTQSPAIVNVIVEADVARRLKIIAANTGALPSVIYRAALEEYVARHEAGAVQG